MKKLLITIIALLGMTFSSQAQTVEASRFFDNWSIGLKGGGATPMKHHAFFGDMRGVVGLDLHKSITPVIGFGLEGQWSVNTSSWIGEKSHTAFDHQLFGGYITGNLMNLFGSYPGSPRVFEVVVEVGTGWLHGYGNVYNSWYTKFGPDFVFNLGKNKAWSLSLKPAIVYDMIGRGHTSFNINRGYYEILAGITYNFKNSNGTHSFKLADGIYTQDEWDLLVAEMESYKAVAMTKPRIVVKEVEVVVEKEVMIEPEISAPLNAVGFNINSSEILPTEYASLENVASWLKENPDQNIRVIGYADKDTGSEGYNAVLSLHRAEAVKDALVKEFGIDPSRMITVGEGSNNGQPFKENNWNRVVIFKSNND